PALAKIAAPLRALGAEHDGDDRGARAAVRSGRARRVRSDALLPARTRARSSVSRRRGRSLQRPPLAHVVPLSHETSRSLPRGDVRDAADRALAIDAPARGDGALLPFFTGVGFDGADGRAGREGSRCGVKRALALFVVACGACQSTVVYEAPPR